jgi:hypothetical protein
MLQTDAARKINYKGFKMKITDDFNEVRKILNHLSEQSYQFNKVGKFRQVSSLILNLKQSGISYDQLCLLLNESHQWMTVSLLRSYVCRFRQTKGSVIGTGIGYQINEIPFDTPIPSSLLAAPAQKNTTAINTDSSMRSTTRINDGKIENPDNPNRSEKSKLFPTHTPTFPKYDISILHNGLSNADLGIPEPSTERKKHD